MVTGPGRVRTVAVVVEVIAHDHGHWCNRCMLSTGVRAWAVVRIGQAMRVQTRVWCHECGGDDIGLVGVDDARQP